MHRSAASGMETDNCRDDKKCVLVVDDEPDVLFTAVELFKLLGFEPLAANSGLAALDILRNHPQVSLLFTDVMMPGLNGAALAREAEKLRPNIPILLASGFMGRALEELDEQQRDYILITKPYRIADLTNSLRLLGFSM